MDAFADVLKGCLIVSLNGKAVHVDHRQLSRCGGCKEILVAVVHALEVVKKFDGGSWEVHDEVRDRRGDRYPDRLGRRLVRVLWWFGRFDDSTVAAT